MPRIKANGLEFEYDARGPENGQPVVLVMGYTAQMINWPDAFCDGVADAGYRVVRFDNRDIGLSSELSDKGAPDIGAIFEKVMTGQDATALAPYLLDDMAMDTVAIIDALGLGPSHIIGASMGGMIAQLVALNHPEQVRSVIPAMTTSGATGLPQAEPEASKVLTQQPESQAREHVVPQGVKARKIIGSHPSVQDSDAHIEERVGAAYDRSYRPLGAARQYAAIVAQPRWHDRLPDLKAPMMVMHGEVDPLIPILNGRDIADRVPGAKFVEVKKWGHDMASPLIPELTKHVTDFLGSVDS